MIKTSTLTGAEVKVSELGGQNAAVKNLSEGTVYASIYPNITPGADNVVEIPAGSGEVVLDANGTVYLLGTGKVQCTGTDYATPNFRQPSSSDSSGGGGGTSDVTKAYVDAQDSTILGAAKVYTDAEISTVKSDVSNNANGISALQADLTTAQSDIAGVQSAVDTAQTAAEAAQAAANANASDISALQTDLSAAQNEISANAAAISAADSKAETAQTAANSAQATANTNAANITTSAAETLTAAKAYTDTKSTALDTRVTAAENAITTLNGTGTGSVKKAVSDGIAEVVAGAPASFDTLQEISDWINGHAESAAAMNSQIATNTADIAALETNKADKTEIPTTLPANGGNAATVNEHTVNADVPLNAKFTDTTYTNATTTKDGLMSSADKSKLDGIAAGANNYVHPTTSGNKHIPAGGSSGQILRWSADGTAAWGADNNTTYSDFVKSGSGAKSGLVPSPGTTAGTAKYLREDGTWCIPLAPSWVQTAGTDLNDYTTAGVYFFYKAQSPLNAPPISGINGWLLVLAYGSAVEAKQVWFRLGDANSTDFDTFVRTRVSGVWSNWRKFETVAVSTASAAAYGANQEQADEIMSQLADLDVQSVRPLRAVAAGTSTDEDTDKLREIETQAALLRAELAELGGD